MSEKIRKALEYHFQNHRLIFWYDEGGEMMDDGLRLVGKLGDV